MNYKAKLKEIRTVILDFDGVLTDGTVFLLPPKEFVRTMHVRDSYAIHYAVKKGIHFAVITGGNSEVVRERMVYLGVTDVFTAAADKLIVFNEFVQSKKIDPATILYIGDDIPDYEVMKKVGLAVCPADAVEEIKRIAHYISPLKGGHGMVREILEQLLKVQDKWIKE